MSKKVAAAPKFEKMLQKHIAQSTDDLVYEVSEVLSNSAHDSEDIMEWFADEVKGKRDWQVYRDGREVYIVTNLKGEGIPDYEDVLDTAAKQAKVDVSAIRSYVTPKFFDDLFWDAVRFEIDNAEWSVSVVGRSGGYWGTPWSNDLFEINPKAVKAGLQALAKDQGALTAISNALDEGTTPENTDDLSNAIVSYIEDKWNVPDYLQPTSTAKTTFKSMGDWIDATVKWFASPEKWAEDIVANQWWNDPTEEDAEADVFASLDVVAETLEARGAADLSSEVDIVGVAIKKINTHRNGKAKASLIAVLDRAAEKVESSDLSLAVEIDAVSGSLVQAAKTVEEVIKSGAWNITLMKDRSQWRENITNPQGGGGGGMANRSQKALLNYVMNHTDFKGADKVQVILAVFDYSAGDGDGAWVVTKSWWAEIPDHIKNKQPRKLSEQELWDMMTR